jgi:tetratricopeptide (TPR) repeat protein
MTRFLFLRDRSLLGAVILAAAAIGVFAIPARADDQPATPTLGEKTSEAFTRIAPLWEAKNWDGVIDELNALIPTLDPNGYDMAFVQFTLAKMLIEKDKLADAAQPLETALRIVDQHPEYVGNGPPLGHDDVNQMSFLLGIVYEQQASDSKDLASKQEFFKKAVVYLKRYMNAPGVKLNPEVQYSYASLLFQSAIADPKHIDLDAMHDAKAQIHKGLIMSAKPREEFYELFVAALQTDNDLAEAAKYTEILVKEYPQKKDYWTTLWAFYTNLAGGEKDEARAKIYYARAINTFERARALGFLNTPKDNYNLITLYYNAGQFRRATELLDAGLKDGSVPDDIKNWNLLAYAYQQINDYGGAIRTYQAAEERYPDDGEIDVNMSQIHSQLENDQAAYDDLSRAVGKPHLERAFEVYRSMAYFAFLLGEDNNDPKMFDAALKALNTAAEKFPEEAAKSKDWKQLHETTEDTIKHLAQVKAAVESQSQFH